MFGNKKKLVDQLLAEGGTEAWATVLNRGGGWQSSSSHGTTNHVKVSLRVEPEGAEPFEATFKQAFSGSTPMTGWQCKVIYDPKDHSRIAVFENSMAPPGLSHEQAERAGARRAEMREAARTGNIAAYIEQRKAEAMQRGGGAQIIVNGQPLVIGGAGVTGPTRPAGAAPAAPDPADQLAQLATLHEKGVLTDQEFADAKAKLLASM